MKNNSNISSENSYKRSHNIRILLYSSALLTLGCCGINMCNSNRLTKEFTQTPVAKELYDQSAAKFDSVENQYNSVSKTIDSLVNVRNTYHVQMEELRHSYFAKMDSLTSDYIKNNYWGK